MIEAVPWWVFALYVSVITAISNDINARGKRDGIALKANSGLMTGLFLTPALFVVPLVSAPIFYLLLFLTAIVLSFSEAKSLDITAKYGGVFYSMSRPITIVMIFIFWNIISFDAARQLMNDPLAAGGVALALVLIILSKVLFLREGCSVVKRGLVLLIIVSAVGSLGTILIKYALSYTETLWQAAVLSCLLNYMISLVTLGRIILFERHKVSLAFSRPYLKVGVRIGFFMALMVPVSAMAIHQAPNPSFAAALFMLSTVWLAGYYKLKGLKTNLHPVAAVLLILSAVVLVVSTANL